MQKGRRILALFLAFAMCCTIMPETFYATTVTDEVIETIESTENIEVPEEMIQETESQLQAGDEAGTEIAVDDIDETWPEADVKVETETETVIGNTDEMQLESDPEMGTAEPISLMSLEDAAEAESIDAVVAVDDYTFLTVGDPLSRTGATSEETFAFQATVSGWYHVKVDSNRGMNIYAERIYIEGNEEKNSGFHQWTLSHREVEDHVFYGQAGDIYLFNIRPYNGVADYTVSVDGAEISRIEVTKGPDTVYDSLSYDGMQIKLIYSDGTFTTTDVLDSSRGGEIEAFCNASALDGKNYFVPLIQVDYYGGEASPEDPAIRNLEDGTHTAKASIWKVENREITRVEFTFDFTVERDAVDSLEVLSTAKTTYEAGFKESFNEVVVQVNYKDGRSPKQISSITKNSELYQYLEINGKKCETVDDYLDNGGSFGQAMIHVSYRSVETTYPITIAENPYSRMEVTLNETQFYADCIASPDDPSFSYIGEHLSPGGIIDQVTLYYKDTSKSARTYSSYYSLPNYQRITTTGLKLTVDGKTNLYQYVDDYLAAGGTLGEAIYEVNYAGVIADIPVEVCANPYSKIEIITPPDRTTYVAGKKYYSIVTTGMVIRAYDAEDETTYTDITVPSAENTMEERRIFRHLITWWGKPWYQEIGTHDITVLYYGHSATYEIEVVDSLISDFTITQKPEYTEYLAGNTKWNWIEITGLEVSFTLNGEKYENLQIYSSEYNQLCKQYSEWLGIDDSKVNFKKAGTYPVKVSFMGATAEYQVKVYDKIVDSITIISPPNKMAYYAGETESVYIDGLEVSVTGLDGQVTNYKAYYEKEDGYGSWSTIDNIRYGYRLDTSAVDFNKPGTYDVVFNYGGVSDTFTIEIKESPVASIEINQMPQKMSYFQFESNVDLYGLNLKIVYKDGTSEIVKVTEHCSEQRLENEYGSVTVRAYVSYDDEGSKCVRVEYMNGVAYYYPSMQSSYADLLGNAAEISVGQTVSVSLDSNVLYQIYKFTPSETMCYEFSSTGNIDTYAYLIDQYGEELDSDDDGNGNGGNFKLNHQLESGTTYYYLVRLCSVGNNGTFTCTLKSGEPEIEITEADITLAAPIAGEALPSAIGGENYSVSVSWTNADNETVAEYAKAYRAKILLTPEDGYAFSTTANIRLNGKKAVSKAYNSNGTISVYYTFPYTDCKVTVPEVTGYALDESANKVKGQTEYGGSYSFRYQKTDESVDAIVVSVDGRLLKADENNVYTITGIKSNSSVSARVISEETKKDWTRLKFYDKETLSDSFYAERNSTVAASGEEAVLPILESYVNGSDQFFFGWYQERDDLLNGIGARFRSTTTVPDQDVLPLYAKWGIGIFSCIYNTKTVNYKVLSIDEDNRLKVQIGDGSKAAVVRTAAAASRMNAEAVDAVGDDDVFVIPSSITDFTGTRLDKLGIEFSGCEVTAIAENAFSGDTSIRKISLPDTITEIGSGAFSGCTNLESIEIPSSVSKIKSRTFSGCENLTNVVLAEGVTAIGENVFEGCSSLKTVIVPDSVEDIDATAFSNSADNLTIICSSNLTDVVSEAAEAAGATIQTVDIAFDYAYADKEFTYGDKAFTVTAKLLVDGKENKDRTAALRWQTANGAADYYTITQNANVVAVTPKNVTDGEGYNIIVTDSVTAQTKSIALSTVAASLARVAAVEDIAAVTYTGSAVRPKVSVKLVQNGTPLVENTDYTVSYLNNTEAGTQAVAKITGINNYCGELTKYFTIQKSAVSAAPVSQEEKVAKIELNKTELRLKLKASQKLTAAITPLGAKKTVTWTSSNTSVATVSSDGTVKAIANGTANITAAVDGKTAVCRVVVPYTITYKLNGGKNNASNPSDYYNEKVTLKNPTRAKYIFAGWYTDKKFKKKITKITAGTKKNYVLYAKWTKISLGASKVSSAKKASSQSTTIKYKNTSSKSKTRKIEVKFKKVSKAGGYEIAYSTNKKYKKSATKTVTSKKNSVTIKLQKGKTYYIRIRAYQVDSTGAKVYGKWTSSKKVEVSK